jgi:ribose transport system permease protein
VGIGLALVLLCLIFSIAAPRFASVENLSNILTQISINTAIAVGMTFVILLGGIDLSVGSVLALATVVAGLTITNPSLPVPAAILLAIVVAVSVGAICGFINGWVSERWKIHSFVVTLGMLNIARGAALQISNSRTIFSFPAQFNDFGTWEFFQIPAIFIIALALVLIGRFILNRTVFGRMIYAIGNNEESVRLSGHNTSIVKILAFTICGVTVGIAAIMYMLRLNIASPILGVGFELKAIAAVVIGGTSMSGGKGSMVGTFLGACIIGVLDNGLLLIGLGDFARQMVTGFIIVFAVIIDTYRIKATQRAAEQYETDARALQN